MTVNISDSGVLFQTEHRVQPGTSVDINFTLPVTSPGDQGARIICPGIISRIADGTFVAAKFVGPRLHRS